MTQAKIDMQDFAVFTKASDPSDWSFRFGKLDAISDGMYSLARTIKGMECFPNKEKMPKNAVRMLDHGSTLAYAEKMTEEAANTFIVFDEAAKKAAPGLKLDKGALVWIRDYRKAAKLKATDALPAGLKTVEHKVGTACEYDAKIGKLKTAQPELHACYVAIKNRASIYCSGQWKKWTRHYEDAAKAAKGEKKKKGTRAGSLAFREWFFKILSETAFDRAKTAAGRKVPDTTAPANAAAFAAWIKETEKSFDAMMTRLAGPEAKAD